MSPTVGFTSRSGKKGVSADCPRMSAVVRELTQGGPDIPLSAVSAQLNLSWCYYFFLVKSTSMWCPRSAERWTCWFPPCPCVRGDRELSSVFRSFSISRAFQGLSATRGVCRCWWQLLEMLLSLLQLMKTEKCAKPARWLKYVKWRNIIHAC